MINYLHLDGNDEKAISHLRENLEICAHSHSLSRQVLDRFSANPNGTFAAIAPNWIEISKLSAYKYGVPVPDEVELPLPIGHRSIDLLTTLVSDFLQTTDHAILVCEDWAATRANFLKNGWAWETHVILYDDDVYHILTKDNATPESIEETIRAGKHYWGTGICSACADIPQQEIPDESFFDYIVGNMVHVFVPAFDSAGYLIWSPSECE